MKSIRLEKSRAGITKEVLDLLDKPSNIFNADEYGFGDDPGRKVVLVKRGTKYANQVHGGSGKSHTTVLLTISADGTCLPPHIIYKSLRLYDQWCQKNIIPVKSFIPKTRHIARPLVLILDNHSTNLSIRTAKLAIQHNIHILCLSSHSTHLPQSLDVYIFKYVKTQWRNLLWQFNRSSQNKILDKPDFVKLFAKLYDYALLTAHCSPSFAKAADHALHQRSNDLMFLPYNNNASERPVLSPAISLQSVVSPINNISPISNETPSINQSFLAVAITIDVSLSSSSNDPLVSSSFKKSTEQDKNLLSAIEKIVKKFFT
ncbi:unnamed protein product [Rotaria socialis]|uniref:DDE-1 domain-containing protein n=2 Tax=Rotaria socialis TaxID=392032 RepID=A0A821BJT4_9BILA|nr:unnamed protein product [Rotaria socialis]CAF4293727.1 unnamed protein product [Rotaria socialis]CAF4319144.1 unnamed protein product [Rotaria socialis]CAF4593907.1 unnamed protein product [Rotaria socialis]